MVPTTGLEPINMGFSPLPALASFSMFISYMVTTIASVFKHYLCICGKWREENLVQILCNQTGCANLVQTKLGSDSVQTCAKIWPAVAHGWPLTRPDHRRKGKAASEDKIAPAIVLRLSASLVPQQRGLD